MFKKKFSVIVFFFQLLHCLLFNQSVFAQGGGGDKNNFILPADTRDEPKYTLGKLKKDVGFLNKYIGTYPPLVATAQGKQESYKLWSEALTDTNAHFKSKGATEEVLSILSELLRQGHNLDVQGAGALAKKTISLCLSKYEDSLNCNFSAVRFYLSIESKKENLGKAKKSLDFLTATYGSDLPPELQDAVTYLNSQATKKKVKVVSKKPKKVAVAKTKAIKKKKPISKKPKRRK